MRQIKEFWQSENAATTVEYGILLACLTALALGALFAMFGNVSHVYEAWNNWDGWKQSPPSILAGH